jgi:hypothetical protein
MNFKILGVNAASIQCYIDFWDLRHIQLVD